MSNKLLVLLGLFVIVAWFSPSIDSKLFQETTVPEVVEPRKLDHSVWLNKSKDQPNTLTLPSDTPLELYTDDSDPSKWVSGLEIDVTKTDHSGAVNYLSGISIDGITDDKDIREAAIYIGKGWDCIIMTDAGCILQEN